MKRLTEMAREAGFKEHNGMIYVATINDDCAKELKAFAELVRADERSSWPAEMEAMERQVNILTDALAEERERTKWDVHSCGPTCNR
jgi:uncharacterized membrane protein YgaE (UPF0421/DUF939 family)